MYATNRPLKIAITRNGRRILGGFSCQASAWARMSARTAPRENHASMTSPKTRTTTALRSPFARASDAASAAAAPIPNSREASSSPSSSCSTQKERSAAITSPSGTSQRKMRNATPPAISPPPRSRSVSTTSRTSGAPGIASTRSRAVATRSASASRREGGGASIRAVLTPWPNPCQSPLSLTAPEIGVLSAENAGSAARGSKEAMVDATAQNVGVEHSTDGAAADETYADEQAGAVSFAELVRAHYAWERGGCVEGPAEAHYRRLLKDFQEDEGELVHSYWSTRRPSAVALTIKQNKWLVQLVTDHDCRIRLHRVTDWLARESAIAELLHHCDTLAIKVSEVLRGSSERIAMQWLYTVESHLLGFIERTGGRDKTALKEVVRSQTEELIEIERYYARAATKAARIVYFWGMVAGAAVSAVLGGGLALRALAVQRGSTSPTHADDADLLPLLRRRDDGGVHQRADAHELELVPRRLRGRPVDDPAARKLPAVHRRNLRHGAVLRPRRAVS